MLLISHRLSTLKECDKIAFFEKGELVDEGSFEHFLVASYANKNILHNTINKYLNEKNENFREDNFYPEYYMRNAQGSADDFSKGITVEGAMKHKINGNTIQNEPLEIGKDLANVLAILQK